MIIDVITPALNEEQAIASVIKDVPSNLVRYFIVCDNGSKDRTVEIARSLGAVVVSEPERGYGAACLKGIEFLNGF